MNLPDFVSKWQRSALTERSAAQQHFLDLCDVLGQPKPADVDPTGETYAFEKSVLKTGGGQGFADVWLKKHFAWEYKGKKKSLSAAYDQLRQYEEALQNPPLLVVCDLDRFEVHTRFNGVVKQVYAFDLYALKNNLPTPACALPPVEVLRDLFENPDRLRPQKTTAQVTEEVAGEFSKIAAQLLSRKVEPHKAARFLIRLLFCLFAEDVGLLPENLFASLVETTRNHPDKFAVRLKALFNAMAEGGIYGNDDVKYFNGGLFEDSEVIPLNTYELGLLGFAAKRDWANVEPSIFGTLFERSLDPSKRAQLGAHYTSRDDILAIVEPVLMAPLRKKWGEVQEAVTPLVEKREAINAKQSPGSPLTGKDRRDMDTLNGQITKTLRTFGEELGAVRVLDPACGSGNFLYVALRALLDLNKAVLAFSTACGVPSLDLHVQPGQMRGIEKNEYAHELAPVTIQIGYIQWLRESGLGQPPEPILQNMQMIVEKDAILGVADDGSLFEPEWPEADIIIGNPPFLGGNKIRQELGGEYVDRLFSLYGGRVPAFADLVCYWFERTRALITEGKVQRAGLLSTNSIRGGVNRRVLERIKESGDIFMTWADRPWVLSGAAVRVSMVGFDNGAETHRTLNGVTVSAINPDLTSSVSDLSTANLLSENRSICFMGPSPKAPFDIDEATAQRLLSAPAIGNNRSNSEVVRPVVSAVDIVQRSRRKWTIDFALMSEAEAAQYELPFEYVRKHVKPVRQERRDDYAGQWWRYARPRPEMRAAIAHLSRFIVTPAVAKHRIFVWAGPEVLCNQGTLVIARADDYFFGVLHSKVHELWALRLGTFLGVGNDPRYTPSTTFETFPFPWQPGTEPSEAENPEIQAISSAARALVTARNDWLSPPDVAPSELQKRTLTNLYNAYPDWLVSMHAELDTAVFAAYGWPHDLSETDVLTHLLVLNYERSKV